MRSTYASISLASIRHNIELIRSRLKTETKYLAVVKANAYGHGMEAVANCALESGAAEAPAPTRFKALFEAEAVADFTQVGAALADGLQVVDARGAARFRGEAAEQRPGVRAGHMPGALNLPFSSLLNADGTLKQGAALEEAFRAVGVDLERPVITSCGSGVTAAILTLGLAVLGRPSRLFDGSWAEWGARPNAPLATG